MNVNNVILKEQKIRRVSRHIPPFSFDFSNTTGRKKWRKMDNEKRIDLYQNLNSLTLTLDRTAAHTYT